MEQSFLLEGQQPPSSPCSSVPAKDTLGTYKASDKLISFIDCSTSRPQRNSKLLPSRFYSLKTFCLLFGGFLMCELWKTCGSNTSIHPCSMPLVNVRCGQCASCFGYIIPGVNGCETPEGRQPILQLWGMSQFLLFVIFKVRRVWCILLWNLFWWESNLFEI